jgi:hypothetical protein
VPFRSKPLVFRHLRPAPRGEGRFGSSAGDASEEPGIISVLITQNGGETAIIGGEGLIVDRPTTRAAFSR